MNKDSKAKKIFEPDSVEELLRGWVLHAHKGRDRHDEAARQYEKYRYWPGIPVIALSAVVGTTVFASLGTVKIVVGLLSMASSVRCSVY